MKNFPNQEFPENKFSKEQIKSLRNEVIRINSLNKDDNMISMTVENGLVIFEINDNENINEYEFNDFARASAFLKSRMDIAMRFEEWKKNNEQEYKNAVKHTVTVGTIKSLISSLNHHNKDNIHYSYLYKGDGLGGGEIKVIENDDKMITFKSLKELNKWVLAQLERVNITNKIIIQKKIDSIVTIFNDRNRDENIAIEITQEKNGAVTITFLNRITHKIISSDVKLASVGKLFDWAEKQKLI